MNLQFRFLLKFLEINSFFNTSFAWVSPIDILIPEIVGVALDNELAHSLTASTHRKFPKKKSRLRGAKPIYYSWKKKNPQYYFSESLWRYVTRYHSLALMMISHSWDYLIEKRDWFAFILFLEVMRPVKDKNFLCSLAWIFCQI